MTFFRTRPSWAWSEALFLDRACSGMVWHFFPDGLGWGCKIFTLQVSTVPKESLDWIPEEKLKKKVTQSQHGIFSATWRNMDKWSWIVWNGHNIIGIGTRITGKRLSSAMKAKFNLIRAYRSVKVKRSSMSTFVLGSDIGSNHLYWRHFVNKLYGEC